MVERPSSGTTLRDGVVTDGPYAESVEQMNGLYLIEVPTVQDAIEAARCLATPAVHLRPLMEI